jgi:hypothetical protein
VRDAPIYIQQDNASTNISNATFQAFIIQNNLHDDGGHQWQMTLINQPPHSSDFNVLDLCFFNSLQVMQLNDPKNTVVQMVLINQLPVMVEVAPEADDWDEADN